MDRQKLIEALRGMEKKYPVLTPEDRRHMELAAGIIEQEDFEKLYFEGYQRGYIKAIKDMAKKVREMAYGGNHKEKRAAGVPEHHAAGAGRNEQKLQRAGAGKRNGRSVGAGA